MSGIPTVPGIESAALAAQAGPEGILLSASLTLDRCNARPIWVYVVPGEGKIWRVFDPLSPTEKLPVWKEWTDEKVTPKGHWEPIPPDEPDEPEPRPPVVECKCIEYVIRGDTFKFDKPSPNAVTDVGAYTDSSFPNTVRQDTRRLLDSPIDAQTPLPDNVKRKLVMFAHADMCAPFSYNRPLTDRRSRSIEHFLTQSGSGPPVRPDEILNIAPCADFNPCVGPNRHERAAEESPSGTEKNPGSPPDGNRPNRRIELFILPDNTDDNPSVITTMLNEIHDELVGTSNPRHITTGEWARGGFPCQSGIGVCHKLTDPADPHQGLDASGNPLFGSQYRQCKFYESFKARIQNLCVEIERKPTEPPEPRPQPQPRRRWVDEPPVKETTGEYHPPPGEHYGYFMDKMVKEGVNAVPQLAPRIAVAPNRKENILDFNLIKPGDIKVVKMDIGFWGDERTLDLSRKSGFRRVPARYFGIVEGPFVFLCYFQTADNAGFANGCSEEFDEEVTPLAARLAEAVRDSGNQNRILIMAKTVAEAGPDESRLNVFFPDMHMPRKFDEKDPIYATDECVFRTQMVKCMVLHQLKRDYRLPAIETPWLSVEDRRLCRDFFEDDAQTLKLPHWNTGRRIMNPIDPEGSNVLSQAVDAAKKAFQFIMQLGFYAFEFTRDDYRRMVRSYDQSFPEKGYGRTKDALFNWFYGFDTDRNIPPQQAGSAEEELKSMIPEIVSEVADTDFGTSLKPDPGTKPATESYANVHPGPARDLLRFLTVIEERMRDDDDIQVFQTGDLYEIWANRRFLFEDFDFTDDPAPQMPDLAQSMMPGSTDTSGKSFVDAAGQLGLEALKFAARNFVKMALGGTNADETDLWFRRECNLRAPSDDLPDEESWRVDRIGDDWEIPRLQKPAGAPVGVQTDPQHSTLKTATVDYTNVQLSNLNEDPERGKAYLQSETNRRIQQVKDFVAPFRDGDRDLIGRFISGDQARWNEAVVDKFDRLGTKFIYGNHDCYRGVPRQNGLADAAPFHSEPGLWVEHAHRFEDSNLDGQPFGAFLTNLAFEIQELAFGEGLIDEYFLHREQSLFQPGVLQWFLLAEFGLDTLDQFQNPPENVPQVHPFRITVNSHTHVPDLVNAQLIFKERESTPWETIINLGGAIVKGLLLIKALIEWGEKWEQRHGFEKWWEDIQGNTINWGADFGGLGECLDKAGDYLENSQGGKSFKSLVNEAKKSGESIVDTIEDNIP